VEGVAGSLLRVEKKGICTRPATNSAKVGPSALAPHEASANGRSPETSSMPRGCGLRRYWFNIHRTFTCYTFIQSLNHCRVIPHPAVVVSHTTCALVKSTISTGGAVVAVAAKRSFQRKALAATLFDISFRQHH
jgi:hypothetical protein